MAPEEQRSLNLVGCLEENGSFSHQFALPVNQLSCPALVLAVRRGDYLLLIWPVSVTELLLHEVRFPVEYRSRSFQHRRLLAR